MLFQSTHPLRGATRQAPRRIPYKSISIHAPLAGCDKEKKSDNASDTDFNPRTPCGVRLFENGHYLTAIQISIHAPLAGCDAQSGDIRRTLPHFNPRTPCGVRPDGADLYGMRYNFNPRTPCGVRRRPHCAPPRTARFQSTHPLRGATCRRPLYGHPPIHFNPRTPCGVRPKKYAITPSPKPFQSTHPLRGATAHV